VPGEEAWSTQPFPRPRPLVPSRLAADDAWGVFTDQIEAIMADVHRAERWLGLAVLRTFAAMLVVGVWRWNRRVGTERLDEEPAEGHSPLP
jgi:hypothetical protein